MTWARPHWLEGVTSAVAALVALAVVHHDLAAGGAVAVTLAALATVALLRPLWAGLPPFVDRWLGLGACAVAGLLLYPTTWAWLQPVAIPTLGLLFAMMGLYLILRSE